MRYQERIYIQNENRAVRNKDMLNVNMSSDFCVFQSPKFNVSGATKVQCGSIVTCELSGVSLNSMLTASTATCLSGLSSNTCLTATTWEARIYENDEIAYSGTFYTTSITGDTPSDSYFINEVSLGLTTLGYTYTQTGSTFTIDKKGNVGNFEIDACVLFKIAPSNFSCPIGFSATPANDSCVQITTTAATFNGSGATIVAGNTVTDYGNLGTYFYPNIQNNGALPLFYDVTFLLKDQSGGTVSATNTVTGGNPFWYNSGTTINGRLNNIGLSADTGEWLGFSKCIDISTAGTYYVGIGADNYCRVTLDGVRVIDFSATTGANFKFWSVFPFYLSSGKHIIEMEGLNQSASSSFGAEIYNPIDFSTLTASTSTGITQANVIFTTANYIGSRWEIGTSVGYSCPSGYSLDTCAGFTCTKIVSSGITGTPCTGMSCTATCTTACSDTFPYINNTSQGVYVVDSNTTSIPVSFNFTANTSEFLTHNTSFKYEVYKYNSTLNVFSVPPVYKSDSIAYSAFSGTNILNVSIPISGLSLDGDYLIKGYYEADACTDFLYRLGKKIDTVIYSQGSEYQLYNPSLDFYFVATTEADVPIFTQSQLVGLSSYDSLALYQQVIFVDDNSTFVVDENTNPDILATGNTYTRSGSTISLNSEYIGDIIVTLNGLTLSKDLDYSLSGTILTFFGTIMNGDVITIVYTRTSSLTIVADTIQINSEIPNGTTGNQGTNKFYYNETTGKYEIYMNNEPLDNSKIVVMLNGATLVSDVDFYQSTSNNKRLILAGTLLVGDIITIVYYPKANLINGITQTNNTISWYIPTTPQSNNGEFSLEYSTGNSFTTLTVADTIPYEIGVTNYSGNLSVTGDVGTNLYYRVKNTKNYESICGDLIESVAYSEIVPIVIQSNAINSY
jgi:hypothetical protein